MKTFELNEKKIFFVHVTIHFPQKRCYLNTINKHINGTGTSFDR